MKFKTDAATFASAVSKLRGVVAKKNDSIPIISSILLTADAGDGLTVRGTNLDLEATIKGRAAVSEPGTAAVPAERLHAFVSKLPKRAELTVELDSRGNTVVLRAGRSRCSLQTGVAEHFPSLRFGNYVAEFSIPAQHFIDLFGRTEFAVGDDTQRFMLTGVYLHVRDGKLKATATDGQRLAIVETELPAGAACPVLERGIIVPHPTVQFALKAAADRDLVKIAVSHSLMALTFGDLSITSKLVDGEYVDYMRAIPPGAHKIVTADRAVLAEAVGRIASIAERGRAMTLDFGANRVELRIKAIDTGDNASEDVEVSYDSDPFAIGFNSLFLGEVLNNIESDQITIELADHSKPGIFKPVKDDGSMFVLMPYRI